MTIRFANMEEHPVVLAHYKRCNYNGGIQGADKVLIALHRQGIIGAVRISLEHGFKILRGNAG